MKVKEIKEIINSMDDEDDFEFRLIDKDNYKDYVLPFKIKCYGTSFTNPLTHYIGLSIPDSEIKEEMTFPNVFYINGDLITLTRVEYENGKVEYKERNIDGIYKNSVPYYR